MEIVYRPLIALLRARAATNNQKLVIEGAEHVPAGGPLITAGNHVSEYDPIVVGLALNSLGRRGRFLAKQELFDTPLLGWMLRDAKQVPVDRAGRASDALPHALLLLDAGETVVLFPEGTISTSFVPADPKRGAARLALASGAPLVPFATWGGQRVGNPDHPVRRTDAVVLVTRFGPAVPYERGEPVEAVTRRLWDTVIELVDEVQRSYPQQPHGHADRWWQPQHLGGTAPSVEEAAEERRRKAEARAVRARARSGGGSGTAGSR